MSQSLPAGAQLPTAGREGGVELLRLVLMGFIIGHHVMVHGAGLFDANHMTEASWARLGLNSFFVVAVDAFIVISGFYGIRLKSLTLIRLFSQTWFYSLMIVALFIGLGLKALTQDTVLVAFLPVSSNLWWFMTNYIFLMMISPLLNRIGQTLSQRQLGLIVLGLLFLESLIGFYFGANNLWGYSGYSLMNFITIYVLGIFLKRFHRLRQPHVYFLVWLATTAAIFVTAAVMIFTGQAGFVFSRAFGYNSPLLILSALCLFFWFKALPVKAPWVFAVSPLVLAVYLIHDHPFVREVLYSKILRVPDYAQTPVFFLVLPLAIGGIFVAAVGIEKLRSRAFAQWEQALADRGLFRKIDEALAAVQPPRQSPPTKPL